MIKQIMEKKNDLASLVCTNGLSSKAVLRCSRELDQLIYQFQLVDHVIQTNNNLQYLGSEENY
ncbi:aspartyl-phosphate phosphatase Spo0E family protein [Bacillus sp. MM2020_4]|nr:aspartyl-phosphate phosphatase Spo0E family protein [Bacillus sp. MM2020_4]